MMLRLIGMNYRSISAIYALYRFTQSKSSHWNQTTKSHTQISKIASYYNNLKSKGHNLKKQQVSKTLKYLSGLQGESTSDLDYNSVIDCCKLIESNFNKKQQLSMQYLQCIRDILYMLKAEQINQQSYMGLSMLFKANFIRNYQKGQIKCCASPESINQTCKYYIAFHSFISYINYQAYSNLAMAITEAISGLSQSEICKIQPNVVLTAISILSNRRELKRKQRTLLAKLVQCLFLQSQSQKLSDIQHIKLYSYASRSKMAVNMPEYQKIQPKINEKMRRVLMNPKLLTQDQLFKLLQKWPAYSQKLFTQYSKQLVQSYMRALNVNDCRYVPRICSIFKFVVCAINNKQNKAILKYYQKIEQLFTQLLEQAIKNKKYIPQICDILASKVLKQQSIHKILPRIKETKHLISSIKIVYHLANYNVFIPNIPVKQWVADLATHKNLLSKIPYQIDRKKQFLQLLCLSRMYQIFAQTNRVAIQYAPYLKCLKTLNAQLDQQLMTINLRVVQNLGKFVKSEEGILRKFSQLFGARYMPSLLKQVSRADIVGFIQFCILSCTNKQMTQICNQKQVGELLTVQNITVVLKHWNIDTRPNQKVCIRNLFIMINSQIQRYSDPNLKEYFIDYICWIINQHKNIQALSSNPGILLSILSTLISTTYTNPYINESVQSLLYVLISRSQICIRSDYQYAYFIQRIIHSRIQQIKHPYLLRLLIKTALQLNILSKQSCEYIHQMQLPLKLSQSHFELLQLVSSIFDGTTLGTNMDKDQVSRNPMIALRNSASTYEQLCQLQQAVTKGLDQLKVNELYQCIILYELPKMKQAYNLIFFAYILRRLNHNDIDVQIPLFSIAIKRMKDILQNPIYSMYHINIKEGQGYSNFNLNGYCNLVIDSQKEGQLVQKTSDSEMRLNSSVSEQNMHRQVYRQMQGLMANITRKMVVSNKLWQFSTDVHIDIIQLCYMHNMINLQYFRQLLSLAKSNNLSYIKYMRVFGKVSRQCVIRSKEYVTPIYDNMQNDKAETNTKYIYEIFMLHQIVDQPEKYLKKLLESVEKLDTLTYNMYKYILQDPNTKMDSLRVLDRLVIDQNYVKIGHKLNNMLKLQQLVKEECRQTKRSYEIVKMGENIKLVQLKSGDASPNKIYGIITVFSNKLSISIVYAISRFISILRNTHRHNVFICIQTQFEAFTSHGHAQTLPSFQDYCRNQFKQVLLQ